jgi:ribonuclease HI
MIKIFTDGGSRGNPGNAACAFVVYEEDTLVFLDSFFLHTATNNFAEYTGLINGLKYLLKSGVSAATAYLDSELVVKQVNGEYKVKDENIKLLHAQVAELKAKFKNIQFVHVRREENKIADKLVNIVLDAVEQSH